MKLTPRLKVAAMHLGRMFADEMINGPMTKEELKTLLVESDTSLFTYVSEGAQAAIRQKDKKQV